MLSGPLWMGFGGVGRRGQGIHICTPTVSGQGHQGVRLHRARTEGHQVALRPRGPRRHEQGYSFTTGFKRKACTQGLPAAEPAPCGPPRHPRTGQRRQTDSIRPSSGSLVFPQGWAPLVGSEVTFPPQHAHTSLPDFWICPNSTSSYSFWNFQSKQRG